MDAQELQRLHDEWKNEQRGRTLVEEGASNILSDRPDVAGISHRNLVALINNKCPGHARPDYSAHTLLNVVGTLDLKNAYEDASLGSFRQGASEILGKVFDENQDSFKENYFFISPYTIEKKNNQEVRELIGSGDKKLEKIVKNHEIFYSLHQAIKKRDEIKESPGEILQFAHQSAGLYLGAIKDDLAASGNSNEQAEKSAKGALELYLLMPERAYIMLQGTAARAQNRLNNNFKDDKERAEYARNLIQAKIDAGARVEANYKEASNDLYKLIG